MKVSYFVKKKLMAELEVQESYLQQALNEEMDIGRLDTLSDVMKDTEKYIEAIEEALFNIHKLEKLLEEVDRRSES